MTVTRLTETRQWRARAAFEAVQAAAHRHRVSAAHRNAAAHAARQLVNSGRSAASVVSAATAMLRRAAQVQA